MEPTKRKLMVKVACDEKMCGLCLHISRPTVEWLPAFETYYCEVFSQEVKKIGDNEWERCPACIAAEFQDNHNKPLHLLEQQSKELDELREENRWRDPVKEPPKIGERVLVYIEGDENTVDVGTFRCDEYKEYDDDGNNERTVVEHYFFVFNDWDGTSYTENLEDRSRSYYPLIAWRPQPEPPVWAKKEGV